MRKWLKHAEHFDIEKYKAPKDPKTLKSTHVGFSGALFKHPKDASLALLVVDPDSPNTSWLEFRIEDIDFFEARPSVAGPEGDIVPMVRIWLKKMSVGVRHTPFFVDDIQNPGKDDS
jgi:inorganic pyrophosphatase